MGLYILKGRVIDAVSERPLDAGMVVVRDRYLDYVGPPRKDVMPRGAEVIEVKDGTIMPGFIDCHAHLTGEGSAGGDAFSTSHYSLILNAAYGMSILLDAGFTGVRDMSLFGPYLSAGVEKGIIRGPRIVPGGRLLSVTAGHGDLNVNYPREYIQKQSPITCLVDGVDECLRGVREQFRLGAKFIKVCATGGVSSLVDGLDDVQFSFAEIKAIVAEASRHGTYVAAHCTGNTGTLQALKAGVTSIEHGIFLDERCVELMVKHDATLVPTLSISLGIPRMRDVLPAHVYEKGLQCTEAALRSAAIARQAGVRMALGTDFSNSKNSPYAENGKEFASMVKGGLSPMEAIIAGTKNAAYLMQMKDRIGTLEKGKWADIVVVAGDPTADISLLAHKDNIKVVLKGGVIEKNIITGI